jgi:hypothetical protein
MTAPAVSKPRPITEAQFQRQVLELAHMLGWKSYHPVVSRLSVKGWPDLVLVRDRVLYRELKAANKQTTPEQDAWLAALGAAGGDVGVWWPHMLETEIRQTLQRREPMTAATEHYARTTAGGK